MAKVSLRVYNREIEGMIEGGQLDEAIAHCQHILKTFPMHIETYRLLGKGFLEGRRYTDAADIFQRALMSVPDDFVSHVGMSIIRDDEGRLDDAIWHMERAYEMQPSNPAIQGELRRLYGRRDGVEPPKIRLSRDALANMYSQGELFNQAITEIRSVLAEDANRADLKVMLARAYFHAGQKVEAAEMAAELLKKYPYCLDALRVLVDVLPGTKGAENTQVYRHRLIMLDPYSTFVTGSVFDTSQVADSAVNLEHLNYKPGEAPAASQPNWASSLGINLEAGKTAEETPAWLSGAQPLEPTAEPAAQPPVSFEAPAAAVGTPAEAAPVPEGGSIPDWMRSVGWQENAGAADESQPANLGDEPVAEPLAQADIPDWLKSMAPPGVTGAEAPEAEATPLADTGGRIPDWLNPSDPGTASASEEPKATPEAAPAEEPQDPPAATSPQEGDALPNWLKGLEGGGAVAASALGSADVEQPRPEQPPVVEPQPPVEDVIQPPIETPAAVPAAKPVEEPNVVMPQPPAEAVVQPPAETPAAVPTIGPAAASTHGADVPFQPSGEAKPLDISDDAFGWLEALAAKQGAKAEELLTKPEDRSEVAPDWVQQGGDQSAATPVVPPTPPEPVISQPPAETPAATAAVETPVQPLPGTLPLEVADLVHPPADAEEKISWLDKLTEKENTPAGALPEAAQSFPASEPAEAPVPAEPAVPDSALPVPVEDKSVSDWLRSLDEVDEKPAAASVMPPPAAPQGPQEEMPDWLKDLEKPEPAPSSAVTSNADTDLPEWLREPVQPPVEQPSAQPAVSEPAEEPEIPTWPDDVAVTVPPPRTKPDEWVSEEVAASEVKAAPEVHAEEIPVPAAKPAEPAPVSTPAHPPAQFKPTGMLSHIPVQDKDAASLTAAQSSLEAKHLNEAMSEYAKLIKRGRLLEEVIHDLREAIYRYPVDVIIWQTLGDAYMRANRLQDALDAYTKAEELVR